MSNPSTPYLFDEFFASGKEESISPFLTPSSRLLGKNLSLKSALFGGFLLALAFISSFFSVPLSHLLLSFVYFLVGTPALIGAIEDLKNLQINIDVLMTFAALLSVLIGSELEGALLLVLFEISAAMENMVTEKTKGTLLSLNQLSRDSPIASMQQGASSLKLSRRSKSAPNCSSKPERSSPWMGSCCMGAPLSISST